MLTETIKLYEDREDVTLTTYVIAEKGEMHEQGKRPAVLICPGGAYMSCSGRIEICGNGVSCICASLFCVRRRREWFSGSVKAVRGKRKLSVPESDV